MNHDNWIKSRSKKLFDCFMDIEASQYHLHQQDKLNDRRKDAERLIVEFGCNHATITNYTNMMQMSSSITIDVFDSKRYMDGDLDIHIGSEAQELWATRGGMRFDFQEWEWIPIPENISNDEEE